MGGLAAGRGRPPGSLVFVGTGIQLALHVTLEARARLERADEVLYLADLANATWLETLNPRTRSLHRFYRPGARRSEIYQAIVEEILARVRRGGEICVAFPGHPGLFSTPTRETIRRARLEGFDAELLPGISAEDCLFADLEVDPGQTGWQSYEATDLLLHRRVLDPSAALVVWQVSVVGFPFFSESPDGARLEQLAEYLRRWYDPSHEVVLYEAAPFPVCRPSLERLPLGRLGAASPAPLATLYVPPATTRPADPTVQAWLDATTADQTPTAAPRTARARSAETRLPLRS